MTRDEVLAKWREQPAAADWGPGERVSACAERPGLFAIFGDDGDLLALLDATGRAAVVNEFPNDELLALAWSPLE